MASCNHVPLEHKEIFCPVCGQPTQYWPPVISPVMGELREPLMEYKAYAFDHNSIGWGGCMPVLNEWAEEGWRVVTSVGDWLILERVRHGGGEGMTEDELRHIEAVLAGVEGYTQRDLFEQGKQLVSEVHCLRAENAALKTQAERDAKVVRHVAEYVALNAEMDDLNKADIDYIERFEELWLRADKAWEGLRSAAQSRITGGTNDQRAAGASE